MGGRARGRQLLLSTATLVGALSGYARSAYATCDPNPVPPDFLCSDANANQQTINANNATVVTAPGFSVNTGDVFGISITGDGALSYTDANYSPLTATNTALFIHPTGDDGAIPGSITVNTNGALTGGDYGIDAFNSGTGAVTVTANGNVTGTNDTGILATSFGGGPIVVTVGANANVFGGTYDGIGAAVFDGTGTVTITVNGNVTGAQDGIDAQTYGAPLGPYGSPIVITVAATATVTSTGSAPNESAIETSFGPGNITVFGTVNGGGNAIEFEPGAPFDDRLELHPTATINGDVLGGPGTDTLALDGPGQGSFNVSQLVDFEIGEKTGTGTWTLTGTNTQITNFTVTDGVLEVDGSMPNTPFTVNGGTFGGTGTVGGLTVNGGTIAPGNSIGTMTVNGAFTLAPGAVYEVEVNAAGQSDKVVVKGTVNLTGATLRVLAANGNYKPKTDYVIIDNDGTDAVKGQFATVSTNLAFLTPFVFYNGGDGNDVVLTLLNTAADLCSVAETRNQCNVARALNRFPSDNPLLLAVLNQTAAGARQAFDALSGEIHASVAGTLADDSRYVREAVLGRLLQASSLRGAAPKETAALAAAGPQVASLDAQAYALGYDGNSLVEPAREPLAFWTRAYGAWGDFDGDGNAATADRDLGGFVSGMDANIGGSWRAGLATGASFSNVDVDARYSAADVETYHLGGYLGGMAGAFALRGGGLWAWSDIETSRAVVFPGFYERQKASYNADTGQLFGEVAYPTAMMGMAVEPFGGLAYVSIDTDSFRERGGPLASLRGSAETQDVGYSTLGLRAAQTMTWGAMLVTPHVAAAWQHAFDDVTPGAALAFASTGIGFDIAGVPLAQDSALIDAGLDFALCESATAGVSYTGQFGEDVQDNGVKGRFTWLF